MAEVDVHLQLTQTGNEVMKEEQEELHIITVKTEDDVKEEESSELHQTPAESEEEAETDVLLSESEEELSDASEEEWLPEQTKRRRGRSDSEERSDASEEEAPKQTKRRRRSGATTSELKTHTSSRKAARPRKSPAAKKKVDQQRSVLSKKKKKTPLPSNQGPFSCAECGKRFAKKSELQTHMTSHKAVRPQKSPTAKKKVDSKKKTPLPSNQGPFSCAECGKRFAKKSELQTHMSSHEEGQESSDSSASNQRPFSCSECGRRFRYESHLLTHMPIHTGESPEVCALCQKRFNNSSDYKKHMLSHKNKSLVTKKELDLNQLMCSVCEKSFVQKTGLIRHRRKAHHICPFCPNQYHHQGALTLHLKNDHEDGTVGAAVNQRSRVLEPHLRTHRPIYRGARAEVCKVCQKFVGNKADLKKHMSIHRKPRHKCGVCKETFALKAELDRHVSQKHKKIQKSHKCPHCPRSFKTSSLLLVHGSSHKHWLPCSTCRKKFETKADLNQHLEMHKENPFMCSVCKQLFSLKRTLIRHRLNKHFICPLCPKQFGSTGQVGRHKIIHNRDGTVESCVNNSVVLEPHLRKHEPAFPCTVCKAKFYYSSALSKHKCVLKEKQRQNKDQPLDKLTTKT